MIMKASEQCKAQRSKQPALAPRSNTWEMSTTARPPRVDAGVLEVILNKDTTKGTLLPQAIASRIHLLCKGR